MGLSGIPGNCRSARVWRRCGWARPSGPGLRTGTSVSQVRRVAPDAVRLPLTGYADVDAAIRAVNDGQLFRFLTKPCPPEELLRACAAALGQHRLMVAERVLLEQTLRCSIKALTDVLALTNPAAFGRGARPKAAVRKLSQQSGLADSWEVATWLGASRTCTVPKGRTPSASRSSPDRRRRPPRWCTSSTCRSGRDGRSRRRRRARRR
jgi:hypothetical protein